MQSFASLWFEHVQLGPTTKALWTTNRCIYSLQPLWSHIRTFQLIFRQPRNAQWAASHQWSLAHFKKFLTCDIHHGKALCLMRIHYHHPLLGFQLIPQLENQTGSWFGHPTGWWRCAHSIGKFFLWFIIIHVFSLWNLRPQLARELLAKHTSKILPRILIQWFISHD